MVKNGEAINLNLILNTETGFQLCINAYYLISNYNLSYLKCCTAIDSFITTDPGHEKVNELVAKVEHAK